MYNGGRYVTQYLRVKLFIVYISCVLAPSVTVENVMISNITDGGSDIAIVIEWNPPAYPNGIIRYYRVEFRQILDPLDVGSDSTRKRNVLLDETVMNVFANITEENDGAPTNVTISGLG